MSRARRMSQTLVKGEGTPEHSRQGGRQNGTMQFFRWGENANDAEKNGAASGGNGGAVGTMKRKNSEVFEDEHLLVDDLGGGLEGKNGIQETTYSTPSRQSENERGRLVGRLLSVSSVSSTGSGQSSTKHFPEIRRSFENPELVVESEIPRADFRHLNDDPAGKKNPLVRTWSRITGIDFLGCSPAKHGARALLVILILLIIVEIATRNSSALADLEFENAQLRLKLLNRFVIDAANITRPKIPVILKETNMPEPSKEEKSHAISLVNEKMDYVEQATSEMRKTISSLEKHIQILNAKVEEERKNSQNWLSAKMDTIQSSTATTAKQIAEDALIKTLYDTSNVHLSVLENLERYGQHRWVMPCDINGMENCRVANQSEIAVNLLSNLTPDKRRKQDKEKFRVVQVGLCSQDLMQSLFNNFGTRIAQFHLYYSGPASNESSTVCDGLGQVLHATVLEQLKLLEESFPSTTFKISRNGNAVSAAASADIRYFDLLVVDSSPANPGDLTKVLSAWFPKLRNDGFVFGHGYGPLTYSPDSGSRTVPVSWLGGSRLSRKEMQRTKQLVDSFVETLKEKSDGHLVVAGDTVWYLTKQKISLANVFN